MDRNAEFYYQQINPVIEASLNHEQKQEIRRVLQMTIMVPSEKCIDLRTRFWFLRKYYMVIMMGEEHRRQPRAYDLKLISRVFGRMIELTIGVLIALMLFLFGYMIKVVFQIDLFPEFHLKDIWK